MTRFALLVAVVWTAACAPREDGERRAASAPGGGRSTLLTTLPSGYEAGEVTFSRNGARVAVVLERDGAVFVSVDSALSSAYEHARALVFDAGSQQFAFVARRDGKEFVVLNGVEGSPNDHVDGLQFSGGTRLTYAARRGGKWVVVSGDKASGAFESPGPSLRASPDGRWLAFIEGKGGALGVRVCASDLARCARGGEYAEVSHFAANPSGSHLAYRVARGGRWAVVLLDLTGPGGVAERVSRWYESVGSPVLSNNGEHVAFFAGRAGVQHLVSGDREWPLAGYSMVFDVAVSDRGNAVYTGAIKDSIVISQDGEVVGDRRESVEALTFSGDSRHLLFVTGPCPLIPTPEPVEFARVVVDGRESKRYDRIVGPRFAPGDTRVVFRARAAGRRFLVVADGGGKVLREHPPHDAVWDFTFSPDGKFVEYGVQDGRQLRWQVEPL